MKRLKKMLAIFLAFVILCGLGTGLPQNILPLYHAYAAESLSEDDFSYRLINGGEQVEITKYNGSSVNVEIPDTIEGKSVSSIGSSAFYNCDKLETAIIPGSVKTIENNAFDNCDILTAVSLGEGLETINYRAFYNCRALKEVRLPDSVKTVGEQSFGNCNSMETLDLGKGITSIGHMAFYDCNKLTEVTTIPDSVITLGEGVFNGCKALSSITLSPNITKIPNRLFYGCTALTHVVIPENVTEIGTNAFYGCTTITSMIIPKNVTFIGNYAFNGCTGITEVTMPDSVITLGEGVFNGCKALSSITLSSNITKIPKNAFNGCTAITGMIIPKNVTEIGTNAFYGCSSITEVTIPDSVITLGEGVFNGCKALSSITLSPNITKIPNRLFYGCTALTHVVIPENVTEIGGSAFYGCSNITEITIPDSVTTLGESVFNGCITITSMIIPKNVTSIGNYAFNGCTGITEVTMPDSVITLGEGVFNGCKALSSITLSSNITKIPKNAFNGCTAITGIIIPENVTEIGTNAFYGCSSVTEITIPDSVITLGEGVFNGCKALSSITLSPNITKIPNRLFYGCTALTHVVIPENVTEIGTNAFYGCTTITSMIIPKNVTSIGNYAFNGCTGITEVTMPDSVITLGEGVFNGCKALSSITLSSNITKIPKNAFNGCTAITGIIIPENVTEIGTNAFYGCSSVTEITIPDSVITLGEGVFNGCKALSSITLSSNITKIPNRLFYGCTALTHVVIPENVTEIGGSAFYGCSNIMEVTMPDSVITFGTDVFKRCVSLSSVILSKNIESIPDGTFEECTALKSIVVPEEVTSIGNSAFNGCTGTTEVIINSQKLESIGSYAFSGCQITEIALPNSINSIGGAAFFNCTALTSIIIPENVTALNSCRTIFYTIDGTFDKCTSLVSVTLPSNLETISDVTFRGCTALKSIVIPESVVSVGDSAFANCKDLVQVSFKNDFTQVSINAFNGCTKLSGFPRPSVTVNSLKIKNSSIEGTLSYANDNLRNYNISVKNSAGKEIFTGITDSCIVIDVNQVTANETVTIIFEHKNGKTLPETVTVNLDNERKASVDEIILREKGYLKINYPLDQKNLKAVVYDTHGNYVDAYTGRNGIITSKYLSGEFDVYIFNTAIDNISFSSPQEYTSRGLILNQDYFVQKITVEDNQLISINLTAVPKNADRKLSCMSEYSIVSDIAQFAESNYITYKITYNMKDESVAVADKLIINLSDNLSFVSGSLSVNDNPMEISTADRYNKIEVSVKDIREGVITLKAMPISNGQYTVNASISFNENERVFSEPLGIYSFNMDFITLNGQTSTNGYSTFITGITSSADPVGIYVNGSSVLEIMPDSNGKYSADLILDESYIENGTEFDIYAKSSAGIESKHLKVQYNFEKPVIEKLYFSQGTSSKQDLTNALYDGSRPIISLVPSRALTYEIQISNSDSIQNVYVISNKNGERRKLKTTYQGDNKWVAKGSFNHSDNIVPGQISVGYTLKSSTTFSKKLLMKSSDQLIEIADGVKDYYKEKLIEALTGLNKVTEKAKAFYGKIGNINTNAGKLEDYKNLWDAYKNFIVRADKAKADGADQDIVDLIQQLYKLFIDVEVANKKSLDLAAGECSSLGSVFNNASNNISNVFSNARNELENCLDMLINGNNITGNLNNVSGSINQFDQIISDIEKEWEQSQDDDDDDDDDDNSKEFDGEVSGRYIIDPSGYVYEAIPENRLSGVTVSIYYKENEDDAEQLWDAAEYEQENMLVTGDSGEFAWEVSEGWYRVEAVKEGYETASSEWMYIPPERTDVYIPMYNYTAPEVESVIMKDGNIEVLFDKFMQISTVTDSEITLLQNGKSIDFTVEAVWDETGVTAENGYTAAKRFLLIPENGELNNESYDIIIDNSVTSYANVTMKTLFSKRIESEDAIPPVSAVIKMNTNKAVVNQNTLVLSSDYIYVNNTAMASKDSLQKLFDTEIEESSSCYKITINGTTIIAYKNTTEWEIITHNNQTLKVNVNNQIQIMDGKAYFSIRDICILTELNLYYTEDPSGQYIIITNAAGADEAYCDELLQSAKPYFDDYGNTFDTAYQWGFSPVGIKMVNGTLDYAGDIDMFKFTAPITGTYTIYSSDITPDLKARLYDSNQMQIGEDNNSGENGNFKITVSLTEGQTYYLKVSHFEENGIGTYTINLSMDVLVLKYNSQYSVFNGNKIENTQYNSGYASMILSRGVSMIPVRFLCEVTGMQVVWNEDMQMVTVTNPSTGEYVSLAISSCIAVKYNRTGEKLGEWKLSMAPQVVNGITMVPLRAVSECLGYYVEYMEKDYGTYVIVSSVPQTENIDVLCETAKKLEI